LFIPPVLAAFAVLTFAFVATVIPKKPASVEKIAPTTKQIAVGQLTPKPIRINSTAAKITRILYSADRNALAPSLMLAAISCILSVPSSILLTLPARTKANSSATIPSTGAR